MARLRYSREEARAEAVRRAEAFVAARPDRAEWRLGPAFARPSAPPNPASKHPLVWLVAFSPIPRDGEIIDGGEMFVAVDLDSGTVELEPGP